MSTMFVCLLFFSVVVVVVLFLLFSQKMAVLRFSVVPQQRELSSHIAGLYFADGYGLIDL